MKVDSSYASKESTKQLKNVSRQMQQNQKELDLLKKNHEAQLQSMKQDNEQQIFDEQMRFRASLGENAEANQEKMHEMQKRMEAEQKLMDQQARTYKSDLEIMRNSADAKIQEEIQLKSNLSAQKLEQLDELTQQNVMKAQQQNARDLAQTQSRNQESLGQAINDGDRRLASLQANYKQLESNRGNERVQEMSQAEKSHQQKMLRMKIKYEQEQQALLKTQQQELNSQMTMHQAALDQEKSNFDTKYKYLRENHALAIARVQGQSKNEIDQLAKEYVTLKDNFSTKSQDPFYRPQILKPMVTDGGDHYLVSLEMPEHERENVQINADKRRLTLQLTRQYKQTVELGGDNTNRSSRAETFVQSFNVPEILEGNSIKQSYKDGHIIFSIKKA